MAMTLQEIFDKVCKHLHKQNKQAMNTRTGGCMYRDSHGRRCAVGCLIKHKDYSKDIEECAISLEWWDTNGWVGDSRPIYRLMQKLTDGGVLSNFPDFTKPAPIEVELLRSLQSVHDEHYYFGYNAVVENELRAVAESFNLSTETLDKLTPYEVN